MATFLVKKPTTITRQSGDDCDITFNIPDIFDLTDTTVKFAVFNGINAYSERLFLKDSQIVVTGQSILVPILSVDTDSVSGNLYWELEVKNTATDKITTIGFGPFVIVKTFIR